MQATLHPKLLPLPSKSRPFSVYLITNLLTNKAYVGKTGNTVQGRWIDHKSNARRGASGYLYRSIRKHGEENFHVQTLAQIGTESEANNLERIWIQLLRTYEEEFGYNLTFGGDGVRANEETKRKIGESSKGRKHSEEAKRKISEANKGRKLLPEVARLLGDRTRGKPLSEEHKAKLSLAKQGKYTGDKHPMFGKRHSPESIEKMSNSRLGIPSWNKGKKWPEKTKEIMSKSQTKRFEDNPDQKEFLRQKSMALWQDPAYREKMKKSQEARYARERAQKRTSPSAP